MLKRALGFASSTIAISTIFLLIFLVPYEAFAGTSFDENFVHAEWQAPFTPTTSPVPPSDFSFDKQSPFSLFDDNFNMECNSECTFRLPNFVDELNTKIIFVDITFDSTSGPTPPSTASVRCFDSTGTSDGVVFESTLDPLGNPNLFLIDLRCHPNPDWETITLQLPPNVQLVEIWTKTFDETKVGGIFEGVDTTALLVTGAQMNAAWMIPVIVSGIGFAIVIARKF